MRRFRCTSTMSLQPAGGSRREHRSARGLMSCLIAEAFCSSATNDLFYAERREPGSEAVAGTGTDAARAVASNTPAG